jgi:hypothetical protein
MFVLHQLNRIFQGNFQTLLHGGLQSHGTTTQSQDKIEEKCEQG